MNIFADGCSSRIFSSMFNLQVPVYPTTHCNMELLATNTMIQRKQIILPRRRFAEKPVDIWFDLGLMAKQNSSDPW